MNFCLKKTVYYDQLYQTLLLRSYPINFRCISAIKNNLKTAIIQVYYNFFLYFSHEIFSSLFFTPNTNMQSTSISQNSSEIRARNDALENDFKFSRRIYHEGKKQKSITAHTRIRLFSLLSFIFMRLLLYLYPTRMMEWIEDKRRAKCMSFGIMVKLLE